MKSTTFALGALMASVAIAQPHRHGQHMAKHHKRNEEVVWVTDWDYVTETVGITTTIWVSEGYEVPTPATASPTTSTSSVAASNSPNQFFENNANKAPATSSSVYVAPTPESTYVTPAPSSTSVAPVAAAQPTSTYVAPAPQPTTSTYVAPAAVETPVYVAPVVVDTPSPTPVNTPTAAPTSAAPVATPYSSPSSSTGGVCSSGSPCEGDITYYEAGLGACGTTNDGNSEKVIALPHGLMGTQSNGNPYCGKSVTISKGGKTVIATVVDKCMGCTGNSIDLSNAAFLELAEFDVGRTTAEWWFN